MFQHKELFLPADPWIRAGEVDEEKQCCSCPLPKGAYGADPCAVSFGETSAAPKEPAAKALQLLQQELQRGLTEAST